MSLLFARPRHPTAHVVSWDARVARAAAGATLVAFLVAIVVTGATDEGGVPWLERLARTLAALPLCSAFGAWVALVGRRGRGELRALAALGRSPARAGLPAALGSLVVAAALTVTVVTSRAFDVSAFFPSSRAPSALRWDGGAFVDDAAGVRVLPSGVIERGAPPAAAEGREPPAVTARPAARAVVAVACLLACAALALFGARAAATAREVLAVLAAVTATIATFHWVAASRLPKATCVIAPIGLFVFAAFRYGVEPWEK